LTEGKFAHLQMVLGEIAVLANSYSAEIWVDSFESATIQAQFAKLGATVHIVSMAEKKFDLHKELGRHIRSQLISFPAYPALIDDLRRLRVNWGSAKPTIVNPRSQGRHGDVGQSLAQCMNRFAADAQTGTPASARTIVNPMPYSGFGAYG
jgi:hypothetical protein